MKVVVTTLGICVASLLVLGLVMLYSSSMVMLDKHHLPVDASMLKNQLVWFAVALLACVVLASLDYAVLRKLVWPVFIGSLLLAALVFVPHIGQMRNGAHRWIGAGGKTFQPSELVKIAIIIAVAWYAERSHRKMHTFVRGAVVPCLIIGFALGLIYVEPDRGTCFLMAIVTGTMLTMVGVRWHHLICLALIGGCLVAATSKHDTMRSNRIKAWWNPKADKTGVSSQGEEAKKAFGHGGLTGVGLGNGLQKNGYVAEIHSDFIFANIGEELGLVATLSVVAAFFMITLCGFEIARQARDQFGCLLAVGITMLISCQAIFNMAVVTSLAPNKGIALPFISAGGSNLLAMLGCVGILISIARHATQLKTVPPDFAPDTNPFAAKAT